MITTAREALLKEKHKYTDSEIAKRDLEEKETFDNLRKNMVLRKNKRGSFRTRNAELRIVLVGKVCSTNEF